MITVTTDAGNTQTFRVVPGMTGSGFLLSPLIETADQFALLPAREEAVARFSISAIGRPAGMFEQKIGVRLKRLHITGEKETPADLDMEALANLRSGLTEHLDTGIAVRELRRRASRHFEGKTRVLKPQSERRPTLRRWSMTIADVYLPEQPAGAADRVRGWAVAIRRELA